MILDIIPNILNMFIRRIENCLRAFEQKVLAKKAFLKHRVVLRKPDSESEFSKSKLLLRFLTDKMFGVSYDFEFFLSTKIESPTTFLIYRTMSYDASKTLQESLKKVFGQKIAFLKPRLVLRQPDYESELSKSKLLLCSLPSLPYNAFGMSYDSDFFR